MGGKILLLRDDLNDEAYKFSWSADNLGILGSLASSLGLDTFPAQLPTDGETDGKYYGMPWGDEDWLMQDQFSKNTAGEKNNVVLASLKLKKNAAALKQEENPNWSTDWSEESKNDGESKHLKVNFWSWVYGEDSKYKGLPMVKKAAENTNKHVGEDLGTTKTGWGTYWGLQMMDFPEIRKENVVTVIQSNFVHSKTKSGGKFIKTGCSFSQGGCTCDASTPPANGYKGTCHANLQIGATCQPTCKSSYQVSGSTKCGDDAKLSQQATCVYQKTKEINGKNEKNLKKQNAKEQKWKKNEKKQKNDEKKNKAEQKNKKEQKTKEINGKNEKNLKK